MNYVLKLTIYESLFEVKEYATFVGYGNETASLGCALDNSCSLNLISPASTISANLLRLSATHIFVGGNLNRYHIFPAFEWIGGGICSPRFHIY